MSLQLKRPIVINWGVTEAHGWGLVGLHTMLYLLDHGHVPLLMRDSRLDTLRPENRARIEPFMALSMAARQSIAAQNQDRAYFQGMTYLAAMGSDLHPHISQSTGWGDFNVGVLPGEGSRLDPDCVERGNSYDRIISHSTYMVQLLKQAGVRDARLALQGVDPTEVGLGPRSDRFEGRFVVFSGGKLELRKGQDIVLRAFKIFHERHPDAMLLTLWNNPWPEMGMDMAESNLAPVAPTILNGKLNLDNWCVANGLVPGTFLNLGYQRREQLKQMMWDCDLAIFPNRCEAGTNLVAMEAMACGVPCILSVNTGHLDLVAPGRCYMLADQSPVPNRTGGRLYWGESSVEELLTRMEEAYHDRDEAGRRGLEGSNFVLTHRTWRQFAQQFIAAIEE